MQVRLIVLHGKHAGQEVAVTGPKFFVGRSEDCHLRPHSDLISRHHCALLVEEGYVAIRDFGSKNGTFVNDQRVKAEAELKSGDHLKIGPLEFEVRLAVDVGGKKLPKVHSVQEAAARTAESPRVKAEVAEEVEVADWLEEDATGAMSDTATMDPTQTIGVQASNSKESAARKAPSEPVAEEPMTEDEPPEEPHIPGTFAGSKKPDAASSRDAASKGLKNLFRRF